ncbi:MFS transporter, partial [Myxococcota bacterium]|nr:MFS transporter [Myxococcota bacterium]
TNWYGPSRGRALGIVATGSTLAGVVLPTIAALLIAAVGWRDALATMALASLVVTLPIFGRLVIDEPRAIGQLPEGSSEDGLAGSQDSATRALDGGTGLDEAAIRTPLSTAAPATTREILRRPAFWATAASFGLLFSLSLVSITFTVPYAEQLGLSLQGGATILAARSLSAIAGQVSLGWLSDRVGQRPVLWGAIAFESFCWFALVHAASVLVFTLAGIGIGFVSGAFAPLRGAIVARVFGRRDFAKVSGLLSPAALPFQILAVPVAGRLYDVSGSYGEAFETFFFVFPVAALLVAFIPTRR